MYRCVEVTKVAEVAGPAPRKASPDRQPMGCRMPVATESSTIRVAWWDHAASRAPQGNRVTSRSLHNRHSDHAAWRLIGLLPVFNRDFTTSGRLFRWGLAR